MKYVEIQGTKTIMGRIEPSKDLLESLTDIAKRFNIILGHIRGIGAVKEAHIGYFDEKEGRYVENVLARPMEIVSLMGNISVKDGEPFVHAHIALGDRDGRMYGGHLLPGTRTFVFEYVITYGEGDLERVYDPDLKLFLWET